MAEQESTPMGERQRAEAAWCAAGRPYIAMASMTEGELASLSQLTTEAGKPVEGFRSAFASFYQEYLDSRKVSDDEAVSGGFGKLDASKESTDNE